MAGLHIAAVMAVHNRRDLTLACLDSLRAQQLPDGALDVFVLDDASSDGTAAALVERHPDVRLLRGDGQLYWNGGMRRAFGEAMAGDYDYYIWLNDDTKLDGGVLARLLRTERELRELGHEPVIVVGTTRHPDTGELTYGGQVRLSRWRRVAWTLVRPGAEPRPCETMNGNTVLIPRDCGPASRQHRSGVCAADGRLRLWTARARCGLRGVGGSRHRRYLRLASGAPDRLAAATAGTSSPVVGEGACAQALAGVHTALGRPVMAHLLAQPLHAQRTRFGARAHSHPSLRLRRAVRRPGGNTNRRPGRRQSFRNCR